MTRLIVTWKFHCQPKPHAHNSAYTIYIHALWISLSFDVNDVEFVNVERQYMTQNPSKEMATGFHLLIVCYWNVPFHVRNTSRHKSSIQLYATLVFGSHSLCRTGMWIGNAVMSLPRLYRLLTMRAQSTHIYRQAGWYPASSPPPSAPSPHPYKSGDENLSAYSFASFHFLHNFHLPFRYGNRVCSCNTPWQCQDSSSIYYYFQLERQDGEMIVYRTGETVDDRQDQGETNVLQTLSLLFGNA